MFRINDFRLVILILVFCFSVSPAIAISASPFNSSALSGSSENSFLEFESLSGSLKEVPPPAAVRQIKSRLSNYHPQLTIQSPTQEEILTTRLNDTWELVFLLKDWPLIEDPQVGLGPHLVVQLDNELPIRITNSIGDKIVIPMNGLSPGSHRMAAYLAYPWGEALKVPGSHVQSRIHFFRKIPGAQPNIDQTWLTVVRPPDQRPLGPVLIDSLIWNAPIQGLKNDDDRWRLKVSINEDSFLLDREEAIWVEGIPSTEKVLHFELLDNLGEPICPIFNSQLIILEDSEIGKPLWTLPQLNEDQLAKFLGEDEKLKAISLSKDNVIGTRNSPNNSFNEEIQNPSVANYELIFPRELKQ